MFGGQLTMAEQVDSALVELKVLHVERVRRGPIIALARVALVLDGVEMMVDGFTVRNLGNQIEVAVPQYRNPATGAWWPVIGVPVELQDAIARAVCAELEIEVEAG